MHVGLVSDVENDVVRRGVKDAVERHRKLDDAEVGGKMPSRFGDLFNEKGAQLLTKRKKLLCGKL